MIIKRNRIGCMNCGDVIESKHVHDWVACSCFKNEPDNRGCYVDGGLEYLRRGGTGDYVEMSDREDEDGNDLTLPINW